MANAATIKGRKPLIIQPAGPEDRSTIWSILEPVFREGATFPLPCDISEADALALWMGPDRETFVAERNGEIVGTYYLRANQQGGGAHVANCGYVTARSALRKGVARQMCVHSLDMARERDFKAMQYNFVVATNTYAIRLWESLDFQIVGRLPAAFLHPDLGYVDVLLMYRRL